MRARLPISALQIGATLGAGIFLIGEAVSGFDLREVGVVLLLASWTRLGVRFAARPSHAAYEEGYQHGLQDGERKARRAMRPWVVVTNRLTDDVSPAGLRVVREETA